MKGNDHVSADSDNPFSTHRIRPGAVDFLFPPDKSAEALVERFRELGRCAEIVGPHGSGKSTLLASLIPAFDRAGLPVVLLTLHDRQRRLPPRLLRDARLRSPAVLVIDGYEQLNRWNRWRVTRFCRRNGLGFLVTAHESVGLPSLFNTSVSAELAQRVVEALLGGNVSVLTGQEVSDCLARHRGDLRETLFELYDIFERKTGP